MEKSSFVAKYTVENKILYGKVDWKNNENDLFCIKLFDGVSCWAGRLSREFAVKYSEQVDENMEDYVKNVKTCLTAPNDKFTYHISANFSSSPTTFSWKKKHEDGTVQVHGSVPIHQDTTESKDSLIDMLLAENRDLRQAIHGHEINIYMMNAELIQSKKDLENFICAKNSLETSVYGKFVSLLNSKKRRIQLLEKNLNEMTCSLETDLD